MWNNTKTYELNTNEFISYDYFKRLPESLQKDWLIEIVSRFKIGSGRLATAWGISQSQTSRILHKYGIKAPSNPSDRPDSDLLKAWFEFTERVVKATATTVRVGKNDIISYDSFKTLSKDQKCTWIRTIIFEYKISCEQLSKAWSISVSRVYQLVRDLNNRNKMASDHREKKEIAAPSPVAPIIEEVKNTDESNEVPLDASPMKTASAHFTFTGEYDEKRLTDAFRLFCEDGIKYSVVIDIRRIGTDN